MKTFSIIPTLMAIAVLTLAGCARPGESPASAPAAAAKPYPLQTCVVSGEKLGSMGDPVVFVHDGQEVKLCCKSCRPDFDKDPAKFIAKINSSKPTQ